MKQQQHFVWIYRFSRIFFVLMILSGLMATPLDQQAAAFLDRYYPSSSFTIMVSHILHAFGELKMRHAYLSYGYGFDWLAVSHVILGLLFMGVDTRYSRHFIFLEVGFLVYIVIIVVAIIKGIIEGMPVWWQMVNYVFGLTGFVLLWAYYHASKKVFLRSSAEEANE